MYCEHCGNFIEEGQVFCQACGARVTTVVEPTTAPRAQAATPVQGKKAKCWSIFAYVGFGVALGSLFTFWLSGLAMVTAQFGLVFSILGRVSDVPSSRSKATAGIILSIVAFVMAIVAYVGLIALMLA
jgi:hypothetical protein